MGLREDYTPERRSAQGRRGAPRVHEATSDAPNGLLELGGDQAAAGVVHRARRRPTDDTPSDAAATLGLKLELC
jgi:hypothetical protein